MTSTRSPRATVSPAVTASWWPWFLERLTPTTSGRVWPSAWMQAQVLSREPSLTSTISNRSPAAARAAAAARSRKAGSEPSSL